MFKLIKCEDVVRIPPDRMNEPLEEVAREQLRAKYEGIIDENFGYVIAITDVKVNPIGKLILGDGATRHLVEFNMLTFMPQIQELFEGEVVEVEDFGAFIRVGPMDALLHISQILDDVISYDERQGILMGAKTGKILTIGDKVRARVTAVSLAKGMEGKIGVTTRQPFLGKLEWIKEEVRKLQSSKKSE